MLGNCPDEGTLRAYLDRQLSTAEQTRVTEHLRECPACSASLAELSKNADVVNLAFVRAAPPDPVTEMAWRRFSTQEARALENATLTYRVRRAARYASRLFVWRLNTMSQNSRVRWQPALAAVLLVAVLLSLVTVTPLRAAAAQFLDIFRVRRLAVLQVQTGQLERLDQFRNQVFSEPQVDRAKPVEVANASEASDKAGFKVLAPEFVPAGLDKPDKVVVETGGTAKTTVNLAAARTMLQMANLPTDAIPADKDSIEVNATLKPGVAMHYQKNGQELSIVESESPEVDVPAGVDLNRIGEVGLQLFGMTPDQARRMSRNIDWSSTLVLPVPANMGSVAEVNLRGTTGYVITEVSKPAKVKGAGTVRSTGPQTAVVWQENGLLYAVSGSFNRTMLLRVAESLK